MPLITLQSSTRSTPRTSVGRRCSIAPLVVDGAMNGDLFRAYVEQMLAPTLNHGDIIIMDNLASHRVAGVREAIEAQRAALVYRPPYGPDLNLIGQAFPKLKAPVAKARRPHRLRSSGGSRRSARVPHTPRMHQLSCQRRKCSTQTESALAAVA